MFIYIPMKLHVGLYRKRGYEVDNVQCQRCRKSNGQRSWTQAVTASVYYCGVQI